MDNAIERGHPMTKTISRYLLSLALAFSVLASAAPAPSHYLFVWAMEAKYPRASTIALMSADPAGRRKTQGLGKDFLAVFDISPGVSFGRLVTMLPVGDAAMAHHTHYAEPPDDFLYANDWAANRTYVFDLRNPQHPRLARQFGSVGAYSYPHSFVYLSNGNTLATFQYSGGFNHAAGGLVEIDPHGQVVKTSSAAAAVDPNIRPYSLAVVQKLDRVVTGSADMMGAQASHVAQVWRLSDLKLLATMQLPPQEDWFNDAAADTSEPRTLSDGKTVVIPSFGCGLYTVQDLAGDHPTVKHIYDFGYRVCEVPVVAGNFLLETMESGHAIVSLDMHDPEHPHEVSRILLPPDEYPHWLGLEPGGNRMAITGPGALATKVRFATIDRHTGKLTLERSTIDLTRSWPDGWQGSAIPHGAVFSNP
jgi:hypothetical protein